MEMSIRRSELAYVNGNQTEAQETAMHHAETSMLFRDNASKQHAIEGVEWKKRKNLHHQEMMGAFKDGC